MKQENPKYKAVYKVGGHNRTNLYKSKCKFICANGKRCHHHGMVAGYCTTHYWKLKKKEKNDITTD